MGVSIREYRINMGVLIRDYRNNVGVLIRELRNKVGVLIITFVKANESQAQKNRLIGGFIMGVFVKASELRLLFVEQDIHYIG